MKFIQLFVLLGLVAAVSGCGTLTVAEYSSSAENAKTLKEYGLKPVSVGEFQLGISKLNRLVAEGPEVWRGESNCSVVVSPSVEKYVEKALIEELTSAGIYDAASPFMLRGKVEYSAMSVNHTTKKLIYMIWISLTNSRNESMRINFQFDMSTQGFLTCRDGTLAYKQAVEELMTKIINDPQFRQIVN